MYNYVYTCQHMCMYHMYSYISNSVKCVTFAIYNLVDSTLSILTLYTYSIYLMFVTEIWFQYNYTVHVI